VAAADALFVELTSVSVTKLFDGESGIFDRIL
jgi:hypothetical protein